MSWSTDGAMDWLTVMPCRAARSRTMETAYSTAAATENVESCDLHPPRLDLRQIEDLVEQRQQMLAGTQDVPEVFILALIEVSEQPFKQHLGESDHRVEWGTKLMRHAGQEIGLVLAHHLQFGALLLELVEELRVVDRHRRLAGECL